jgi:hypothetical protein
VRAKRSGESALLLLDVVDILVGQGVKYAVIGALAASVYGAVRASMDADVLLSVKPAQVQGLFNMLAAAGFKPHLAHGGVDDPIPALLKVADKFGNRVDLLIGLKGLDPLAFSRLSNISFRGQELQFIGREDFIAMKVFAGGPLDIADAARAVLAAGTSLDVDMVRRLARGFSKDALEALERILRG